MRICSRSANSRSGQSGSTFCHVRLLSTGLSTVTLTATVLEDVGGAGIWKSELLVSVLMRVKVS